MKRMLPALLAVALTFGLLGVVSQAAVTQAIPEPETTGNFEGTWYYIDPGFQIAIFVDRDAVGALRLRYHVRTKSGTEYETDAGGFVKFIQEGNPVEVLFTGSLSDSHRIKGYHERTIRTKAATVQEAGDFELYLAEKGRKLVLHYPQLKVSTTPVQGTVTTTTQTDVYRIFRKASEIVVDFSEIPF